MLTSARRAPRQLPAGGAAARPATAAAAGGGAARAAILRHCCTPPREPPYFGPHQARAPRALAQILSLLFT